MTARILIAASSKNRAHALAEHIEYLQRETEIITGKNQPKEPHSYRLLIWEGEPRVNRPGPLIRCLRPEAHKVLLMPGLDIPWVSYYMQNPQVNHFLTSPVSVKDLQDVIDKLATGAIFGLDRYLPAQAEICYRRISSFKERCDALDEIDVFTRQHRLRGHIRRSAVPVAEELLMNAMYQAPINTRGKRIFEDVEPRVRIRRRTPRPVSLRYAAHNGSFYLSIRDRFGSFRRKDLATYLLRCVTENTQIEEKRLGAGLGLYLVSSTATRFVINVLPGSVAEFICILEPPTSSGTQLKVLSVTTQRPFLEKASEKTR